MDADPHGMDARLNGVSRLLARAITSLQVRSFDLYEAKAVIPFLEHVLQRDPEGRRLELFQDVDGAACYGVRRSAAGYAGIRLVRLLGGQQHGLVVYAHDGELVGRWLIVVGPEGDLYVSDVGMPPRRMRDGELEAVLTAAIG